MQDGFDADLLLDQHAKRQRTHAHPRHRTVRHVDRIRAMLQRDACALEHLGRAEPPRGVDLDAHDELPGAYLSEQPGWFGCGLVLCEPVPAPGELTRTIGSGASSSLRCGAPTASSSADAHGLDVRGRRAAAAADQCGALGEELGHPFGKIVGRGRVNHPLARTIGQAGVGHGRQLESRLGRVHLGDEVEQPRRPERTVHPADVRASSGEGVSHLGRPATRRRSSRRCRTLPLRRQAGRSSTSQLARRARVPADRRTSPG